MFADFHADGRWSKEDRLKSTDVEAGAAEQELRTWTLMISGPIGKSRLSLDRTFSAFLDE